MRCCLMTTLPKSWFNCQHLHRGRRYRALYPCHVCTLLWPLIVVQGQKVALWCAKWFTEQEDTNKVFVQEPGQEVTSNFKHSLWINNSPRSISLLLFYFPSLPAQRWTEVFLPCHCHCKLPLITVYLATCLLYFSPETCTVNNKCKAFCGK